MRTVIFLLSMLLPVAGVIAQDDGLDSTDIDRIAFSVVQIAVVVDDEVVTIGSGTIISEDGKIYTNRHVIDQGSDFLILTLTDINDPPEPAYFARLAETYSVIDFAVLQIDRDLNGDEIDPEALDLEPMAVADEPVTRGDRIFIFGYPGIGDGYLVFTEGTIAAIRNGNLGMDRQPVLYQTTAEIAPGNSGGLAVNGAGQMVGIPTLVRSEGRTGGRLGGILPITAVQTVIRTAEPDQVGAPVVSVELDSDVTPRYGSVSLAAGFSPDPYQIDIVSGGEVDATYLAGECRGFAARAPDFGLTWTGQTSALRIFFETISAGEDTVLIVQTPDGEWYCNDDAHLGTLNPMITLSEPSAGMYAIWVASYRAGDYLDGTLFVTEAELRP